MVNVRDLSSVSHYALRYKYLANGKRRAKLCNNTWVEDLGESVVGIRLHNTTILMLYPDGRFRVNSGGYRTVTTKQRINALLPSGYRVFSKKFEWFMSTPSGDVFSFDDGDVWPPPQLMFFNVHP